MCHYFRFALQHAALEARQRQGEVITPALGFNSRMLSRQTWGVGTRFGLGDPPPPPRVQTAAAVLKMWMQGDLISQIFNIQPPSPNTWVHMALVRVALITVLPSIKQQQTNKKNLHNECMSKLALLPESFNIK